MSTTIRAVIYARVSSAAQRDAHTIEAQLQVLRPFVKQQGWQLVGEFIDDGRTAKTGKLEKRLGYAQLLAVVGGGQVDVVVTAAMDRLTRTEDLIELGEVLGPLQRAGVRIVSPSTGEIDLRSEHGRMIALLQANAAAIENARRAERIKGGKQRAIANGKKPAGPTPYGYRYDRWSGVWSIDEAEAEIVREVFRRAHAGETGNAIAEDLRRRCVPRPKGGVWLASRVYQLLRQTAYRGEWVVDKVRKLTIATPAIVEPSLWFAVAARHASVVRRGPALRRTKHEYLLEGLAVCGVCGARIGIASGVAVRGRTSSSPARYVCANRRRTPLAGGRCILPYFTTAELDARVWNSIAALVLQPGRLERVARDIQNDAQSDDVVWLGDAKEAEKRVARLERTSAAIVARFSRGLISEQVMDEQLETLRVERAMADEQLAAAHRARFAAARAVKRGHELGAVTESMRQRAAEASPAKRRELALQLLQPGAVRISIAEIALEVRIRKSAKELAGPQGIAGSSSELETSITIRLVA